MADKKISALDVNTLLTGSEYLPLVQPFNDPRGNKRVTIAEMLTLAPVLSVNGFTGNVTIVESVTSVFGRTGAITKQVGDYDFSDIGNKPTTFAGYGILGNLSDGNGTTGNGLATNLGGTLTVNTLFNGDGFNFEIGQSGDRVYDFRVYSSDVASISATNGVTLSSGSQSISFGTSTPVALDSNRNGSAWSGSWTATADLQYHILLAGGTYTARNSASDTVSAVQIKPTIVAAADTQRLVVLDLSATFTHGAFNGVRSNLIYSPNFTVQSTGQVSMGSTASPPTIGPVGNTGGTDATGSGVKVEGLLVGTTQTTAVYLGLVNNSLAINSTATGNVVQILMPSGGFAPSSGAYNLRQLYSAPRYNQTGTSSGNVIFCEYSPDEAAIIGNHYGLLMNSSTARHSFGAGLTPTNAKISIGAGTTSLAPLKFISGTNLTSPIGGVMEYDNTFHVTNSDTTRRHVVTAPNTTKVTAGAPYTNDGYVTVNIGGTDFRLMTTA